MALSIKDPVTEKLAHELAEKTGENVATAMRHALEERLQRIGSRKRKENLLRNIEAIQARIQALPVLDNRGADEILGYDENGLPR
ncbi:type II toxin-antitoxin system VapB family antitoxin [Rhizobium leucaenae]|uniref:type II toxin-antitoxin system VapB family antitoxin n=1 Tax=Rhizobium leucaenae TaxID=29450 RepID=UPI00040034A3|nr:type II toxin-antitoxin system VapB family antitoxin [Rhizobium leucaenae]